MSVRKNISHCDKTLTVLVQELLCLQEKLFVFIQMRFVEKNTDLDSFFLLDGTEQNDKPLPRITIYVRLYYNVKHI